MLTTIQVLTLFRLWPFIAATSALRRPISLVLSNPGGCTVAANIGAPESDVLDDTPADPVAASTIAVARAAASAMATTTLVPVTRCCLMRRFITPPVNGYIAIATLHAIAVQSQEREATFFQPPLDLVPARIECACRWRSGAPDDQCRLEDDRL